MKRLQILLYPNQKLNSKCEEVFEIDEYKDLAYDMLYTLDKVDGIGLAANQVGELVRLIVIKIKKPHIIFNPVIIKTSKGKVDSREGCLSFPGNYKWMRRYKWVSVEFLNENGKKVKKKFRDLEAKCFQHELDHLNGITFLDRKT